MLWKREFQERGAPHLHLYGWWPWRINGTGLHQWLFSPLFAAPFIAQLWAGGSRRLAVLHALENAGGALRNLPFIGDMGKMMGLDNDWAKRAIAASGNYGEIFEANIGLATPIKLARGLNALWTQGGDLFKRVTSADTVRPERCKACLANGLLRKKAAAFASTTPMRRSRLSGVSDERVRSVRIRFRSICSIAWAWSAR